VRCADFGLKSNGWFGRRVVLVHHLTDRLDDRKNLAIVVLELSFQFIEFVGELLMGRQDLAQFYKRANDEEAGIDGLRAVEDRGGHDGAVLGENTWGGTSCVDHALRSQFATLKPRTFRPRLRLQFATLKPRPPPR